MLSLAFSSSVQQKNTMQMERKIVIKKEKNFPQLVKASIYITLYARPLKPKIRHPSTIIMSSTEEPIGSILLELELKHNYLLISHKISKIFYKVCPFTILFN